MLDGVPLIERILARLAPQVAAIAISANGNPARFATLGLPVLPDETAGLGPLAGILAGLRWATSLGATALLTVPVDTPFFPTDLAERLHPPPATAATASRTHPTVALWPVTAAAPLAAALATGMRRVRDFADTLAARRVAFSDEEAFFNINTMDDLTRASRAAGN